MSIPDDGSVRLVTGDPGLALACWQAVRATAGRRPSAAALDEASQQLSGCLVVLAAPAAQALPDDVTVAGTEAPAAPHRATSEGYAAGRVEAAVLQLVAVEVLPAARGRGTGAALTNALTDLAYGAGARRVRAAGEPTSFWEALGLERDGDAWWAPLDAPERTVVLHSGGLRLGQLLKLAGLVETGAEAKTLLAGGTVLVDDEPEARRGRQLGVGDVVRVGDQQVRVVAPD